MSGSEPPRRSGGNRGRQSIVIRREEHVGDAIAIAWLAPPDTESEGWFLTGRCATVLRPAPATEATVLTRVIHAGSAQDAKRVEHPIPGL